MSVSIGLLSHNDRQQLFIDNRIFKAFIIVSIQLLIIHCLLLPVTRVLNMCLNTLTHLKCFPIHKFLNLPL